MKRVLIYSTCQGLMIRDQLYECAEFLNEYIDIEVVQNYQLIWGKQNFLEDADRLDYLKTCDVFIYQPLQDGYKGNATNHLLEHLKPTAQKITIPYVWNTAFWPVPSAHLVDTTDNLQVVSKPVIKNKGVIINLLDKGFSIDNILQQYKTNQIDFHYGSRWNKMLKIMKLKEQSTDVKVLDFINDNYKHIKLFASTSHPTADIVVQMTNQILCKLGLSSISYKKILKTENSYLSIPYDTTASDFFKFEFLSDQDIDNEFYVKNILKIAKEYQDA